MCFLQLTCLGGRETTELPRKIWLKLTWKYIKEEEEEEVEEDKSFAIYLAASQMASKWTLELSPASMGWIKQCLHLKWERERETFWLDCQSVSALNLPLTLIIILNDGKLNDNKSLQLRQFSLLNIIIRFELHSQLNSVERLQISWSS